MSWALESYMDDKPSAFRNKSVKSTTKSSIQSQQPREQHPMVRHVQTVRRVKRESLAHTEDMIYNPTDPKPWSCKSCQRQYKWKNSLNCHIKNECGQPPKFYCERMCGYKTNINSNLKRHLNSNCKPRFFNSNLKFE